MRARESTMDAIEVDGDDARGWRGGGRELIASMLLRDRSWVSRSRSCAEESAIGDLGARRTRSTGGKFSFTEKRGSKGGNGGGVLLGGGGGEGH